jgi:Fe-S oxidoreductase
VHGHCHQKAFDTLGHTLASLRAVPGAKVAAVESGCCGMAGSFGHEHYDESMAMAELSLLPAVRQAPAGTVVVAAGTSCRSQIGHGARRAAVHPAVALADALAGTA